MGITDRYGPSDRERRTGLLLRTEFEVPAKVVKMITGITEDMLIRRIEKRFSRYKRSIPVGKLRVFLAELRERCYVAKN